MLLKQKQVVVLLGRMTPECVGVVVNAAELASVCFNLVAWRLLAACIIIIFIIIIKNERLKWHYARTLQEHFT